ncbi:MAG TPA: PAS domain S-box protein [Candidatus Obscuribacterales bacterium]
MQTKKEREHLSSIVRSAEVAIIGKNLKGEVTSWNEGAKQVYGYDAHEVIGRPISILVPPNHLDEVPEILDKVLRGEKIDAFETQRITKTGEVIDVLLTISPVMDRLGNITGASTIVHDITRAKRAERALREAKDFSDCLFRFAPDALLLVDEQGRICCVNPQGETLFGYKEQELVGRAVEILIPVRFRERHVRHRQAYQQDPQKRMMGVDRALCGLRKDGSEVPVAVSLSPIQTDKGKLTMAAVRDLSERVQFEAARKRAEDALRAADATVHAAVPAAGLLNRLNVASAWLAAIVSLFATAVLVGVFLKIDALRNPTPFGTYIPFNSALCLLLTGISLYIANQRQVWLRRMAFIFGAIVTFVAAITFCEWTFGWNAGIDLLAAEPLLEEDGFPGRMACSAAAGFLFLGAGICALSLRRTSVSHTCALFACLIGLVTQSGWNFGFPGLACFGTSKLIAYPMTVALTLAGIALLLCHPQHGPAGLIASPSLGGKVARTLLPVIAIVPLFGLLTGVGQSQYGDVIILIVLTTVVLPAFVWVAASTIDRLDRQKDQALDKALMRWKELESVNSQLADARDEALEASRLKSMLIANISHELRTPLSCILGINELLLGQNGEAKHKELLVDAQESARLLKVIVDDLLDLSRVEAGKIALEAVPFNLPEAVRETYNLCVIPAQCKDLAFELNLDPTLPEIVEGDSARIRQVLLNLINNAIKFTRVGKVTVEVVKQEEMGGGIFIRFAVTDTGIGISEDNQRLLFLPFSQVGSLGTRRQNGAGLGLALCKSLVELMGGTIGVRSKESEGSEFWFTIPLKPTSVAEPERALTLRQLNGLTDRSVLVVEDSPTLRKIIVKQIESFGLRVSSASTGEEALALFAHNHWDLVLMDVHLPDMSGLNVAAEIRRAEIGGDMRVPIVAITAAAMTGDREKCLASGMDDFLGKPVTMPQLEKTVRKWLG